VSIDKEDFIIGSAEGKSDVEQIKKEWGEYTKSITGLIDLSNAGKLDQAQTYREKVTFPLLQKIMDTLDQTNERVKKWALQAKNENDIAGSNTFTFIIASSGIIGLVLILFAFFLTRSITVPLTRVVEMLNELTKGHLGMRLSINQKDECHGSSDGSVCRNTSDKPCRNPPEGCKRGEEHPPDSCRR
jgi:methyl-accepting chemotaxis protein